MLELPQLNRLHKIRKIPKFALQKRRYIHHYNITIVINTFLFSCLRLLCLKSGRRFFYAQC